MDPRLRHRQTKGAATVERLLLPPRHISTLQLSFRVRIVIRDVGPAVGLGDIQIDEQSCDGLGSHAGAAIGMQGQGAWESISSSSSQRTAFGPTCLGLGNRPNASYRRMVELERPVNSMTSSIRSNLMIAPPSSAWSTRPIV